MSELETFVSVIIWDIRLAKVDHRISELCGHIDYSAIHNARETIGDEGGETYLLYRGL